MNTKSKISKLVLPNHLIIVVNICKYFVFCTLKKAKGPKSTKKVVCKEKLREKPCTKFVTLSKISIFKC